MVTAAQGAGEQNSSPGELGPAVGAAVHKRHDLTLLAREQNNLLS